MVKNNQGRPRPQGRKNFKSRPSSQSNRDRDRKPSRFNKVSNSRFGKRKFNKKNVSVDQLDKELEVYWGNEVGSKHLDKDMDDYWQGKKVERED